MLIGEKIKRLRKECGWTQEQLGELVGVKKAAINKYETGNVKDMKRSTIAGLAKAFGVSPVWLMDDEQDWPPVYITQETQEDLDEARLEALHQNPRLGLLFDRTRKMSHDDVEFMLQFADRILKERDGDE